MRAATVKRYLLLISLLLSIEMYAQNNPTFTVEGKINSSNNLSFSAATAGDNPAKVELFNTNGTDNTSMYLRYKWPFMGTWGDESTYLNGQINFICSQNLPSGLSWTISAAEVSSNYGQTGTSSGAQLVGTTKKNLLYGIWSTSTGWLPFWGASSINSTLTQILSITNFADIHPTPNGNFQSFVLTYTLE